MLVTDNLKDFAPAGHETFETSTIRFPDGFERALACHILSPPDGFEIVGAHAIDFASWIGEVFDPTPNNVRDRFAKPARTAALSSKPR